jgi:t-SNARE complex subunit (syntaxin)
MIDNIESNISNIAVDTNSAADELTTAHAYQRKAGRRAACLMIVLVVVVCVVFHALIKTSKGFVLGQYDQQDGLTYICISLAYRL